MKIIDLLNIKSRNELMPKLIKIMWLDYEVTYYLDDEFWYRDTANNELLIIKPNILNVNVEIIEDKPEKIEEIENSLLEYKYTLTKIQDDFNNEIIKNQTKINEVIDKLNYLLEKSDKDD